MSVKLLFEDNEKSPSSVLLKHSMHGDNIYFSGGSSKLLDKLGEIYEPQDIIFVMHDVSPNNRWTIKFYDTFVQEIKCNQQYKDRVYTIPIVCIEYYLCKFLNEYHYLVINNSEIKELSKAIVDEPFDYSRVPVSILNIDKLRNSLEKMYKHIIKNQAMKCMNNRFEYDKATNLRRDSLFGIFYEKDCTCEDFYCKAKVKDNISIKAERLYTSLPVFAVESKEHREVINKLGIVLKNIDMQTLQFEMQNLYNEICDSMGIHRIKINI